MARYLFEEILCNEVKFPHTNIQMQAVVCFKKFFLWINEDLKNIVFPQGTEFLVASENLIGLNVLWNIAFLAQIIKVLS